MFGALKHPSQHQGSCAVAQGWRGWCQRVQAVLDGCRFSTYHR